jgi:Domain of unknown function (DUF3395)
MAACNSATMSNTHQHKLTVNVYGVPVIGFTVNSFSIPCGLKSLSTLKTVKETKLHKSEIFIVIFKMISSQYSKSAKDEMKPILDALHPPLDQNVLATKSSGDAYNGTTIKATSRRRFPSSVSTKTNHKVVLEVPLQYGFASGRDDVAGTNQGWRLRQTSRLSLNSSFPVLAMPPRYQNNAQTKDYPFPLLQNVTCQVAASSAIRGRTGYSAGSIRMQYRHVHTNEQSVRDPFAIQTLETQRWTSTISAGIGFQQLENSNGESDAPARSNAARALPFPVFHLGCTTNVAQAESSTSTSFSANVQIPKLSKVVLPLTVSNQQRIRIQSRGSRKATRCLDMRAQCTTIFDYSTRSSKLKVPNINATVLLSPTFKANGLTLSTVERKNRRILQNWSLLVGLNKQKDDMKPILGVSLTLQLPKILRNWWKTAKNPLSNNVVDLSLQWKGGPFWHMNGWWSRKQMANSKTTNPSLQRPIRQIGLGVTFNHGSSGRNSSSKQPLPLSPFGILSWIFTWTEGDFTVRIPILLSGIAVDSIWYHQGFQIFYLSFLSSIIQDVVGQFMDPVITTEEESELESKEAFTALQKNARKDAILQQRLMERPAKTRTALEVERNGLVIRNAFFYLDYQDVDTSSFVSGKFAEKFPALKDTDYLDVTVPLQFWLSPHESKLLLYGKRSSMLGFYDLAAHSKAASNGDTTFRQHVSLPLALTANTCTPEKPSLWDQFLSIFLLESIEPKNNGDTRRATSAPTNKLWIEYDLGGLSYGIIVSDTEDIEIPSPKAKLLV